MNNTRQPFEWLNNDSRQFLNRGYLLEGQTPEGRIREIADYAGQILNDGAFADKFYEYMGKGWMSLSSPIWSNFGLDRGLPIACVTGDTWVNTKVGGAKQAKDIQVGDEVLTHKGRYRKVTAVMPTENRSNIYKLKVANRMTPLYITGNHLVKTNMGWTRVDELNPDIHLVAINREIEYVEEDYVIDLSSYLNTNTDTNTKSNAFKETVPNTKVEVTEDLAWALGLWFAEGSLNTNNNKNPNGIRITVNDKDEKQYADRWLSIMSSAFGVNGSGYSSKVHRNNQYNSWYSVNLNSGVVGRYFASFGKGCKVKQIPNWVIDLPKAKLAKFLEGMLLGDGYISVNGTNSITLANPNLIMQLYQIGLKLGKEMSLQMQTKAGKLATITHVYTLVFRKSKLALQRHSGNSAIHFEDGLSYAPIKELVLTDKVETVYDFTVEEDHSFSVAGVVVHNCFSSFTPDSMSGILSTVAEVGMMSKYGGGTSGYFGEVRPRGSNITNNGKSEGAVNFMRLFDTAIDVTRQGSSRRGAFAAYLPIDHGDILEFLEIKSDGNPIQNLFFGVCVTDDWMTDMINGDTHKRKVWAKVLEKRKNIGLPYIFFTDNANRNTVDVYKDKKMLIRNSNLC